jgi:hypothetical protein
MTKTYQGKEVTVVRAAKVGDKGFDAARGSQSLIKLADGSEKVVNDAEVTSADEPAPPAGGAAPKA